MAKKQPASKKPPLTRAQAERVTKQAAKKRTITIALTPKQLETFTEQWKKLNPAEAAELIFTDGRTDQSLIKVAGYSYHGNTCCA